MCLVYALRRRRKIEKAAAAPRREIVDGSGTAAADAITNVMRLELAVPFVFSNMNVPGVKSEKLPLVDRSEKLLFSVVDDLAPVLE